MKHLFHFLLTVCFFCSCNTSKTPTASVALNPFKYEIVKHITVSKGAVVSAHPLATTVGVEILKKGGNAIDAAIATQFALAVVYPNAGNIGGGGFLVARLASGDEIAIDYREKASLQAHRDMYLDADGNALTNLSQDGHLSGGVPGTVAGLFMSHKYARLPMKVLIQPAIDLAEKGFAITAREASSLNGLQKDLLKFNTVTPVFVKNQWKEKDTLVQKDLAATLRRIRDQGKDGFYKGETAQKIVEEMVRGKGIISYEDLVSYTAVERQPHVFDYKGYRIIGMPMPSSGGVLVNQMMKMVENRKLHQLGFHSPQAIQLMAEAERRAFADRATYMGDADFYNVPVKKLTSEKYLEDRMKDFTPGTATESDKVGPGIIPAKESEETTHLSVIDNEGNAVAVTTTLNNSYGSKTVIGGAGFFLNDEMDDFSIKPGVPNMYGALGGEANSIKPGKRMLSAMSPTVVLKDQKPYLVVGTPGGTTIPTSVFQSLLNILEFNLSAIDAVNKPKFHHQWRPDTLRVERDFPNSIRNSLKKMGYKILQRENIGRTELILVLPDGRFEAVADKRGDDSAGGW